MIEKFHRLFTLFFFFYPIREFSLLGLFIIGVGTGGIKPCVSAFGGEQFVRPQQDKQLEQFFSYFYISINAGSLISTLITPILREDVQCFGQNSCFPLAFGVPAVLMLIAIGMALFQYVEQNLSQAFYLYAVAFMWRQNYNFMIIFLFYFFITKKGVFFIGKWNYKMRPTEGNIMVDVSKCIAVSCCISESYSINNSAKFEI